MIFSTLQLLAVLTGEPASFCQETMTVVIIIRRALTRMLWWWKQVIKIMFEVELFCYQGRAVPPSIIMITVLTFLVKNVQSSFLGCLYVDNITRKNFQSNLVLESKVLNFVYSKWITCHIVWLASRVVVPLPPTIHQEKCPGRHIKL